MRLRKQFNELEPTQADRGTLYWTPTQVRVWTSGGRIFDLGQHGLESAKRVAAKHGFRFVCDGVLNRATVSRADRA